MEEHKLDAHIVRETVEGMLAPGERLEDFKPLITAILTKILLAPLPIECDDLQKQLDQAKEAYQQTRKAFKLVSGVMVDLATENMDSKDLVETSAIQAPELLMNHLKAEPALSHEHQAIVKNNMACAHVDIRQPVPEIMKAIKALEEALAYTLPEDLKKTIADNRAEAGKLEGQREKLMEAEALLNNCLKQR